MPNHSELNGGGPWEFNPDSDLAPGDSFILDFANRKYNGKKGWFKKFLPLDEVQVTNESSVNVRITFNNANSDRVVANNVETFDGQAFRYLEIENISGSTTIAKSDITVTAKKKPYGADEAARDKKQDPWLKRAADDVIPGGTPW